MRKQVTREQVALIEQGVKLQNRRRFAEAERLYQTVLRQNPHNADALNLMGVLAIEANHFSIALDYLNRAVRTEPDIAMYRNNLGNALIIASQFEDAVPHLRKATQLEPRYAEAWTNLGKANRMLGDTDAASRFFRKALEIDPVFLRAKAGLAEIASETGRFAEAQAAFEEVLRLSPRNVEALCGIAQVRKFEAGDPLFDTLRNLLSDVRLRHDELAPLHHSFAKMCNDIGDYDAAFMHFAQGKKLKKLVFHEELHKQNYETQKQAFTPEFYAERKDFGSSDERPVFIVGMPRSGTTLTEQVLSAHGAAQGMGEMHDMRKLVKPLHYGTADPRQYVRSVAALSREEVGQLAQNYIQGYQRPMASARRLVDKSPHNYELLGLIALMFPRAHIIHCRRDPMDNCVAIYMQNFNDAHGYNKDLATLGSYYRQYQGLMDHWRQVLPLSMHENVYEKTVAEFESSARDLVRFLGLEWDPNCLNYHTQDRQVRTPSRWQVRQPIYSSSVERWRRYDKHLGPLKNSLGLISSVSE